jgi:hypothetical protein
MRAAVVGRSTLADEAAIIGECRAFNAEPSLGVYWRAQSIRR